MSLNKKERPWLMTYDVGNPGPGSGQIQNCGGVKPVNVKYS